MYLLELANGHASPVVIVVEPRQRIETAVIKTLQALLGANLRAHGIDLRRISMTDGRGVIFVRLDSMLTDALMAVVTGGAAATFVTIKEMRDGLDATAEPYFVIDPQAMRLAPGRAASDSVAA